MLLSLAVATALTAVSGPRYEAVVCHSLGVVFARVLEIREDTEAGVPMTQLEVTRSLKGPKVGSCFRAGGAGFRVGSEYFMVLLRQVSDAGADTEMVGCVPGASPPRYTISPQVPALLSDGVLHLPFTEEWRTLPSVVSACPIGTPCEDDSYNLMVDPEKFVHVLRAVTGYEPCTKPGEPPTT
jgi:hypothetical protein